MTRLLNLPANLFPVWVLSAGGLAVIMLGMGLTLTFEDFRRDARR